MKKQRCIDAGKKKILQQMNDAITNNDPDAFAEAFEKLSMNIQENILSEVEAQQQAADTMVLAGRGVHQLTSEETKYYQSVIQAMSPPTPSRP